MNITIIPEHIEADLPPAWMYIIPVRQMRAKFFKDTNGYWVHTYQFTRDEVMNNFDKIICELRDLTGPLLYKLTVRARRFKLKITGSFLELRCVSISYTPPIKTMKSLTDAEVLNYFNLHTIKNAVDATYTLEARLTSVPQPGGVIR